MLQCRAFIIGTYQNTERGEKKKETKTERRGERKDCQQNCFVTAATLGSK